MVIDFLSGCRGQTRCQLHGMSSFIRRRYMTPAGPNRFTVLSHLPAACALHLMTGLSCKRVTRLGTPCPPLSLRSDVARSACKDPLSMRCISPYRSLLSLVKKMAGLSGAAIATMVRSTAEPASSHWRLRMTAVWRCPTASAGHTARMACLIRVHGYPELVKRSVQADLPRQGSTIVFRTSIKASGR